MSITSQTARTARAQDLIPDRELRDMERMAVELARLAGAEIQSAFGGLLAVKYKNELREEREWRDPVSEVDHHVETLFRTRLADRFPEHDILGEEMVDRPGRDHEIVWVIDPIDGTTNFVNGFPLFAASIGVLCRGRPILGALWCSTSHALRSGVYHARCEHRLYFDEEPLDPKPNPAVRRHIAGMPHAPRGKNLPWDTRKTGSAAIECAFAAAGLLRVACFDHPNIWDVAGGICLVQAAGGDVLMKADSGWAPLQMFEPLADVAGASDLRHWNRPIIVGEREAAAQLCKIRAP